MRDADACLKLAPRFAKAHFAKGRALYFLCDYEAAFVQYDAGLRLEQHPRIAAWLEAERHKWQELWQASSDQTQRTYMALDECDGGM